MNQWSILNAKGGVFEIQVMGSRTFWKYFLFKIHLKWCIIFYLIVEKYFFKALNAFFLKLKRDKWEDISPKREYVQTCVCTYESQTSHGQTFKYCTYKGTFLKAGIILRCIFGFHLSLFIYSSSTLIQKDFQIILNVIIAVVFSYLHFQFVWTWLLQ